MESSPNVQNFSLGWPYFIALLIDIEPVLEGTVFFKM